MVFGCRLVDVIDYYEAVNVCGTVSKFQRHSLILVFLPSCEAWPTDNSSASHIHTYIHTHIPHIHTSHTPTHKHTPHKHAQTHTTYKCKYTTHRHTQHTHICIHAHDTHNMHTHICIYNYILMHRPYTCIRYTCIYHKDTYTHSKTHIYTQYMHACAHTKGGWDENA